MGGWGTGRWGEDRWGEGSPTVDAEIIIEASVAAVVSAIKGGWGTGRWGEDRWGEGSPTVDAEIVIEAVVAAPVTAIEILGSIAASIEITAVCAVVGEITLPAPKALRLSSWLRPAL